MDPSEHFLEDDDGLPPNEPPDNLRPASASDDSDSDNDAPLLYRDTRGVALLRNQIRRREQDEVDLQVVEEMRNTSLREFDKDLPSVHSYLPYAMVNVSGATLLESGWIGRVLCWRHETIVFPGETVPMIILNVMDAESMRRMVKHDRFFGLVFCSQSSNNTTYGVVCEVMESSELSAVNEQPSSSKPFTFKARARERFKLTKPLANPFELLGCREIEILPDIITNDYLQHIRLNSHSLGRHINSPKTRLNELSRRADAMSTPWPQFVLDRVSDHKLTEQIKAFFLEMNISKYPCDSLNFSFWVATNFSLPSTDRLKLFTTNSVQMRLYLELEYIKNDVMVPSLLCSMCYTQISKNNGFSMSNEGIYSNFVNMAGHVHDVLTVKEVCNVTLQGRPSMEFTWFPGYSWTIAICSVCGTHLGWKFIASNKSLIPQSFWGLCRKSIVGECWHRAVTVEERV